MSRFLWDRFGALDAYVPGEQPRVDNLIKLNTNESPFPPSPRVEQALSGAAGRLRLYSDLSAAGLTGALSRDLGVEREQLIAGNGSDEILYFSMLCFGGQGAAFADITYGFYQVWADLIGIDAYLAPLRADFSIDPEMYAGNSRMILIANPNAPTGMALGLDAIERVLSLNPDQVVVVDEAYVDFGAQSALPLLKKYENLLVVRTFSKSRQLAGARLGFAVGAPQLIEDLNKIRYSINPYNVNTLTQLAGTASVEDVDYFNQTRAMIVENREYTRVELEKLGFCVLPSSANFLFARHPRMSGGEYMRALRARNILVRWFDKARISDYVRISIGTRQQMQTLIEVTAGLEGQGK